MKWYRFVSRVRLHKLLLCLILLAFVKGGSLLLLGGLPTLVSQWAAFTGGKPPFSPSFFEKEGGGEDIRAALQAMQAAVARETARVAYAAETEEDEKESRAEGKDLPYLDQMQALKRRQQELSRREQDLNALQAQLEEKIEELKKLEASVKKMLNDADATRDQKVAHLVEVYRNMKPQQAAQVLETLEDDLAVKILSGMDGRTAGKVLSYVKAQRAAALSEKLTRLQIPFTR